MARKNPARRMPNASNSTCACDSAIDRLFARLSETRIMFKPTSLVSPMAESVARFLDENTDLKLLASQLACIKRLQRRYRSLAPERLAEASRVCAIDGTIVVICATSGPVAAALRQLAPRLLEGLRDFARKSSNSKRQRDQELTSIRIEVQVMQPVVRRTVVARAPLPRERLAKLADSPAESPLRDTLERISGVDQSKRTRSKT